MLRISFVIVSLVIISTTAIAGQNESSGHKGVITGRVICDDRMVLAKLEVNLWRQGNMAVSQQAVIDEAGGFQFDNLAPGAYSVTAYAQGYISADDPPRQRYYRPGDDVTLKLKKGGVITGTVTEANGEPVVGVQVRIISVRTAKGHRIYAGQPAIARRTDDRGVYRIYGLPTGSYIVVADSFSRSSSSPEIDIIAPTYHPSSTRDAAAEVNVQSGEEVYNIDIRYRNERGYSVSGILSGTFAQAEGMGRTSVQLFHAGTSLTESSFPVLSRSTSQAFEVQGVSNGEYELVARSIGTDEETASSPVRVTVRGADVTGVDLKLVPLGSLTGRLLLERMPERDQSSGCKDIRPVSMAESIISVRRDLAKNEKRSPVVFRFETEVDDRGEFKIKAIAPGHYRFDFRLPSQSWYARSIRQPSASDKAIEVSSAGITVKQSEKVAGITITVSEGGASLRGKVVSSREDISLPSRLRIHLIPAEREAAEDLLRYSEVSLQSDASFAVTNIAPGKYRIAVQPATEDEFGIESSQPVAWNGEARKKLRLDGEATGTVIDLKSCQNTGDYLLRYAQPTAARPAKNSQ